MELLLKCLEANNFIVTFASSNKDKVMIMNLYELNI